MPAQLSLTAALALWLLAAAAAILAQRRLLGPGNTLVGAYLVNFWIFYWPGALAHAMPWYLGANRDLVRSGFQQSLIGLVAFGCGAALTAALLRPALPRAGAAPLPPVEPGLGRRYIVAGLVSALLIFPFSAAVPSLTAIVSMANLLVVVGMALRYWQAWQEGDRRAGRLILAAGLLLPLFTVTFWGFVSFGVAALSFLLMFAFSLARIRLRTLVVAAALAYLALSAYVTYFRDRGEIRAAVWGGASVGRRTETLWDTVSSFEALDLRSADQLRRLDERLNHSVLVGASVAYLDLGLTQYAGGATLWSAATALVPRVLWPTKPVVAGGSALVSSYTGLEFAPNTTVGIGQVMEFYINFGAAGVACGFFVLGAALSGLDWLAVRALRAGDGRRFALWFLAGLGLIQVQGALFELSASLLGGLVAAFLVNRFVLPPARPAAPPPAPRAGPALPR